MRKRVAFGLLLKGLEQGWNVPDAAVMEGVDTALELLRDVNTGPRDRLRAAELLTGLAERRQDRLVAVAKFEGELAAADKAAEIEDTFGLGKLLG